MLNRTYVEGCECGCEKWVLLYRERGVDEEGNPVDLIYFTCDNCGHKSDGAIIAIDLLNGEVEA